MYRQAPPCVRAARALARAYATSTAAISCDTSSHSKHSPHSEYATERNSVWRTRCRLFRYATDSLSCVGPNETDKCPHMHCRPTTYLALQGIDIPYERGIVLTETRNTAANGGSNRIQCSIARTYAYVGSRRQIHCHNGKLSTTDLNEHKIGGLTNGPNGASVVAGQRPTNGETAILAVARIRRGHLLGAVDSGAPIVGALGGVPCLAHRGILRQCAICQRMMSWSAT